MKSTGEVMGIADDFEMAFAKSQIGAGMILPTAGTLFVSVKDSDKDNIVPGGREAMLELGFEVIATGGTHDHLAARGLAGRPGQQGGAGRPHIVDRIVDGEVHLVFNTTEGWQSLKDSQSIRATALNRKVPYFTTAAASQAMARAIGRCGGGRLKSGSLQTYYSARVN
jgi:carbamoyl-phosphate synthase large subunit